MNYTIINQFALPPYQSGGTRHYSIAKELILAGHDVTIIASNVNYSTRERFEVSSVDENIDGVKFAWIKTVPYSNGFSRLINHIQFAVKLFYILGVKKSLTKPDIIVASSPQPFSVWVSALLSKKFKSKLFYEVRDLWPQSLIDLGLIKKKSVIYYLFNWIESHVSRVADKILCLMPGGIDYFGRKNISSNKILWSPNGIDFRNVKKFDDPKDNSRKNFVIGYFGSHGHADGIEFLIKISQSIKSYPIEFRLYGDGPDKKKFTENVHSLGLRNILFFDSLPKINVAAAMNACDALIVLAVPSPLYKWGISFNKIYDYFSVKKAIIFIGDVFRNPVAESNAGIVIKDFDVNEASDAIILISKEKKEVLREMGNLGYSYALVNHSIANIAKTYDI